MNYMGTTGLILQINAIFFANLVLSNALSFFKFAYYMKLFAQWSFKRALRNHDKESLSEYTQGEINQLFEREEFDIASRFAVFFRNLALAMLFLPILPIGVFFSIGAITIEYWIVKWTVLRRTTSRITYSKELAESMKGEFDFCLVCFTCGMAIKEMILSIVNSEAIWIETVTII